MRVREGFESRPLRARIRGGGPARFYFFPAGRAAWAALVAATAALASTPVATLLPLLVLAAIFEAVFALHVGVERIGRYLQVFYESDAPEPESPDLPTWERAAMAFGRPARAVTTD